MRKITFRLLLGVLAIIPGSTLTGCVVMPNTYMARFSPPVRQDATVTLKENDFQYLERNIEGSYSYWTLAIIPLGDPRLFSNALADLYSKSQQQTEGKATQMVNWTLDAERFGFWPLLYQSRATFRSDLIEFTK